jgi:predicted AlkP superfamily pyrophosphatase or phosphodiesterase
MAEIPDLWTEPKNLRQLLQQRLGPFPLFKFWGPATSIESTRWLASAAIELNKELDPTLTFVYLPHLDYNFQRLGPDLDHPRIKQDLAELDAEVGRLIDFFQKRNANIISLLEYGIAPSIIDPINRILRNLKQSAHAELGHEQLDAGGGRPSPSPIIRSRPVNDPSVTPLIVRELERMPGIRRLPSIWH